MTNSHKKTDESGEKIPFQEGAVRLLFKYDEADGTKTIAMFKLPGGAVVAHGSQQPERGKIIPDKRKQVKPKDCGRNGRYVETNAIMW